MLYARNQADVQHVRIPEIEPGQTYTLVVDDRHRIDWIPREGETHADAARFFNAALARVKAPFTVEITA